MLKVYCGETEQPDTDIVVMETNIDDCSGEIMGYVQELLMAYGALDVFYTPIYMKKNRPGYCLSVICREERMSLLQKLIFRETTTIGIRYRYEHRAELPREIVEIDTKYGKIKAKKVIHDGETYLYPEYESIKESAKKNGIPLKKFYRLEELV